MGAMKSAGFLLAGLGGVGLIAMVVLRQQAEAERRKATWAGFPFPVVDMNPAFSKRSRRILSKPLGVMIHHSDTPTPADTRRVLKERGLSTNYEVAGDGTVYRYLEPATYIAWHGGKANKPYIGIDVTHRSGAVFPEPQVAATVALVQTLAKEHGFTLQLAPDKVKKPAADWIRSGVTLVRHRNVYDTACPENFPMERLVPATIV